MKEGLDESDIMRNYISCIKIQILLKLLRLTESGGWDIYSAQMILIPAKELLLIILFTVKEELEDLIQDG
jgi:hypothetical protein